MRAGALLALALLCSSVLRAAPTPGLEAELETIRRNYDRVGIPAGYPYYGKDKLEKMLAEVLALDQEVSDIAAQADAASPGLRQKLDSLNLRSSTLQGEADSLRAVSVANIAGRLKERLGPVGLKVIGGELEALERRLAELSSAPDAGARSAALWEDYKAVSASIDHIGDPRSSEASLQLREKANAFAAKAAALRDKLSPGQTRPLPKPQGNIVGDPRGRAALVHQQRGQSCSIVSQEQLLIEYGRLPKDGDLAELEDKLYRESVKKGYFGTSGADPGPFGRDQGRTRWEYSGDLLTDYGLIIAKHSRAGAGELLAAAKSGKMLIADVNAGALWGDPSAGSYFHTIVVTGAELAPDGSAAAYFINDSGVNAGGRRVPAEQFLQAWREAGSRFIEVL